MAERVGSVRLRHADGEILVGFRVSPSARRTRVQGLYGDRIKIQLSAPPEDDKANRELVTTVARWLGLSADSVTIRSGQKSRDKQLAFRGVDESRLRALLERLLDQAPPA
jgi:uncharacterized protein (TIGR00251 family)